MLKSPEAAIGSVRSILKGYINKAKKQSAQLKRKATGQKVGKFSTFRKKTNAMYEPLG